MPSVLRVVEERGEIRTLDRFRKITQAAEVPSAHILITDIMTASRCSFFNAHNVALGRVEAHVNEIDEKPSALGLSHSFGGLLARKSGLDCEAAAGFEVLLSPTYRLASGGQGSSSRVHWIEAPCDGIRIQQIYYTLAVQSLCERTLPRAVGSGDYFEEWHFSIVPGGNSRITS